VIVGIQVVNTSETRERILDAAAKLFSERGYAAVTLRDIAATVGIRHTSLYHHVPGGKEELFVEVTERHLHQHRRGLAEIMTQAAPDVRSQLYAAAQWFMSQSPVDLVRMSYADMPAIDPQQAARLSELAFASLLTPIEAALQQAQVRGEIHHPDLGLVAGGLVGMVQSLYSVPESVFAAGPPLVKSRLQMAYDLIDVMLCGLGAR
jgi:AcrR family transcriptional regulator